MLRGVPLGCRATSPTRCRVGKSLANHPPALAKHTLDFFHR